MKNLTVHITCPSCGSGINVIPSKDSDTAVCKICDHEVKVNFRENHFKDELTDCVVCDRKDFYQQKDFNRKIGVILYVIAALFVPWTYGLSLPVLYIFDLILHKYLGSIVICYKCQTIYRNVSNIENINGFDHEMNDRIVYSDHDFHGTNAGHN